MPVAPTTRHTTKKTLDRQSIHPTLETMHRTGLPKLSTAIFSASSSLCATTHPSGIAADFSGCANTRQCSGRDNLAQAGAATTVRTHQPIGTSRKPCRDTVTPPQLSRDAPVLDVVQPAEPRVPGRAHTRVPFEKLRPQVHNQGTRSCASISPSHATPRHATPHTREWRE